MAWGGLHATARASGAHLWFESRMFEILGAWVPGTEEPEAKLMLDRHSLHHAWRAGQWEDRLPVGADWDHDALGVAPSAPAETALDVLAGLSGTIARLAGAYRAAIPRLASAYAGQLATASPVSDGSVIRTLEIVSRDLHGDWQEGEFLLQALMGDRAAVDTARAAAAEVEAAFTGP